MSTIRCPECKMVNWATALNCKRCAHLFQAAETAVVSQATAAAQPVENNYSPDFSEPQFQAPAFQPEVGWGNNGEHNYNQNYNQNYGGNYRQPNYAQSFPQANLKIGLAVTSMILGVLAILTTIFLIGILVAPVGLILGIVALVKAKKKPNQYGGKGFAIAGVAASALVTLLIPLIVAIAVPNIMAARRFANEMSAISVVETLADAENAYRKGAGRGYCADLKTLIASNSTGGALEKDEKNGYRFNVISYPLGGCEITATPLSASQGDRSFYFSTDDNLIRAAKKNGKPADKNDPLLAEDIGEEELKPQIPMLQQASEVGALASLRNIQTGQAVYMSTEGEGICADLQTLANQQLIKPELADGADAGYRFTVNKPFSGNCDFNATPIANPNSRSFYAAQDGMIRGAVKNGMPADKNDPPLN